MKTEEAAAIACIFILLTIVVIGVGCAAGATIELFLTDDWRWSVKAIHFLLIAWLSWKALMIIAKKDVEDERDNCQKEAEK